MIQDNAYSDDNLMVLQKELTSMLAEFIEKCDKNHLQYYLFYGTMLGAVRHHGFIPWDDDVDLLMPRPDVDRLVELYKNYYSDTAHLDGYNCPHYESFAPNIRINSDRVMLRQDRDGKESYVPAFLSIWIIDGLPDDPKKKRKHIRNIFRKYGILRLSRSAVQGTLNIGKRSIKERIIISINRVLRIGSLITPRKAAENINNIQRKYPWESGQECFIGWYPGGNRVYQKKWFDKAIKVKFENLECVIPSGFHEMLSMEYGKYMELPPEEQRRPLHNTEVKIIK